MYELKIKIIPSLNIWCWVICIDGLLTLTQPSNKTSTKILSRHSNIMQNNSMQKLWYWKIDIEGYWYTAHYCRGTYYKGKNTRDVCYLTVNDRLIVKNWLVGVYCQIYENCACWNSPCVVTLLFFNLSSTICGMLKYYGRRCYIPKKGPHRS